MGSVKEIEILKNAGQDHEGEGVFTFSDRYSVFDWGEMPDHIENKGAALCMLSSYFFELLEKEGIKTHFKGLEEDGKLKKFSEISGASNKMRVSLVRVIKPVYDSANNTYNYSEYKKTQVNYLIPLEVIYRNALTEGSSVFKRVKSGQITFRELGYDHTPRPGEILKTPILDVSTKLEHTDRYILWPEASAISGMDERSMETLKNMVRSVDMIITDACTRANIKNIDGKFEFGMDSAGNIMVVDVLGTPDECRFMSGDFHISKEFARMWYRKTPWYDDIEAAKKSGGRDWKQSVKNQPPKLPPGLKQLLSQMYMSVTNEITGKNVFDSPPLKKVIQELVKYDR